MDTSKGGNPPSNSSSDESLRPGESTDRTLPIRGSPSVGSPSEIVRVVGQSGSTAPAPSTGVPFGAATLIANRYRIVRFIGQGGMGDVYEAEDLELHERVALKTVRPEIAADARSIERFKREIQLARRVTHPNVCRIFDLGYHRLADGGEITFLTMELLEGETLSGYLRSKGCMTPAEALPLVTQMASALGAAHEAGIVHRDFKPGNVMLVPIKGNSSQFRVVVTDFGLARRTASAESYVASLSVAGEVVGTPAYMSPEQVEGREITSATDIYALGAVMYEMMTAHWPFAGETPFAVAVRRLTEPPSPPRAYVPDLDPKWEAVILRCLAREVEDRISKAADVVSALQPDAPVLQPAARAPQRSKRGLLLATAGIVVVAIVAVVARHLWQDSRQSIGPSQVSTLLQVVKPRRSVAVLGFKNLSGRADRAWLSTALSEMLGTELASSEKLRAIPGEEIAQMKAELSLSDADSFAKETLGRVRSRLGSDLVVVGSYLVLGTAAGGQIRLDLRLQDTIEGATIASVVATGTEDQLFAMVSKAGAALREKLGVAEPSSAELGSVQASLPSNPEAARLYSQGLAKLRVYDAIAGRDLLQQAVTVDPAHPLPHSALAAAWTTLGYDAKAREEARKAFELSTKLTREDRFLIEARYRETNKEWDEASEIYSRLFVLFPDSVEYGLRLAAIQTSTGKAKSALETLQKLRGLPAPLRDDARLDLAEATAAGALSEFSRQRDAARKAEEKGKALGARLLVARALVARGQALWVLGESGQARAAYEEARQTYRAVGDLRGVADSYNYLAHLLADQADFQSALTMYDEAKAIYQEIGNRGGQAHSLNNIAMIAWQRGDLKLAKSQFEKALPVYEEIGDKQDAAAALDNLGNVLWEQGDLAGARKFYEQSLSIRREVADLKGAATSLLNIGNLLLLQANLAEARKMYEESLSISNRIGDRSGSAFALFNLGEVSKMSGDLEAARKNYDESLKIRTALGEKTYQTESRIGLAEVALESGKPVEAEPTLRQVIAESQQSASIEYEVQAQALMAKCQLSLGRIREAGGAADAALALVKKAENQSVRLYVQAGVVPVLAASGREAQARRLAEETVAQTKREGLLYNQYEAELSLGEIEIRAGAAARGRARITALQAEASARGFGLIARKATAALSGSLSRT